MRAANKFFQHLRRRFTEIRFHRDAADSSPRLLPAEDVVHQVAELVEENLHVAVFHQASIARGRLREIADEGGLRHLFPADSI